MYDGGKMTAFTNQWVLITGASRGVGRQLALSMAQSGARLLLHARTLDALAPLAKELEGSTTDVRLLAAELEDEAQVRLLIAEVQTECGCPDVIYNHAAIMTPWSEPHTTSAAPTST